MFKFAFRNVMRNRRRSFLSGLSVFFAALISMTAMGWISGLMTVMLNNYVKKHSQMKTFLHSCGSIYRLLPDLIEAGYDIINPVQTMTHDMEPARLKKEFGNHFFAMGLYFANKIFRRRYGRPHGKPDKK